MAKLFAIMGIIFLSFSASAQHSPNLLTDQSLDFTFAAPVVSQAPAGTDTVNPIGAIVYDISAQGFKGLFQNGSWGPITQGSVKVPTIHTYTTGSGTYTTPASVIYIRVRMVGGGGGGGGGGTIATLGGSAGNSTFGTSFLVANGATGSTGGSASLGSALGVALSGGNGFGITDYQPGGGHTTGGIGAASPFGGAGAGVNISAGTAAIANSGSGGGGGGANASANTGQGGAGGGAGGYVDAIITSPAASYSYTIGAGGTGGTAGTSGSAGGAGGSGYIIVEEFYQ